MNDCVDSQRLEAVFTWINDFFGSFVELEKAKDFSELWKEHIPTLANLCSSKGMLVKKRADSASESFLLAKAALEKVDKERLFNGRPGELDPEKAAEGSEIEIYKFALLLLSVISIDTEEYFQEAETVLKEKDLHRVMAQLMAQVNSSTGNWWRNSEENASPRNENTSNSGKFRSALQSSPIKTVANSPISNFRRRAGSKRFGSMNLKKKEDLKRLREREAVLEEEVSQLKEELERRDEKERHLKEEMARAEEKWRAVEEEKEMVAAEWENKTKELQKETEHVAVLMEKVKNLEEAAIEDKEEMKVLEGMKTSFEKEMEILKKNQMETLKENEQSAEEVNELRKELNSLQESYSLTRSELEKKTVELEESERNHRMTVEEFRKQMAEKEEEYFQELSENTDLRLQIRAIQQKMDENEKQKDDRAEKETILSEKLEEMKEEEIRTKEMAMESISQLGTQVAQVRVLLEEDVAKINEITEELTAQDGDDLLNLMQLEEEERARKEIQLAQERIKDLEQASSEKRKELEDFVELLDEKIAFFELAAEKVEKEQSMVYEEFERRLSSAQKRIEDLQKMAMEREEQHNKVVKEYEEDKRRIEDEIKIAISERDDLVERLTAEISSLHFKLDLANRELTSLRTENKTLEENLKKLERELDVKMEAELEKWSEEFKENSPKSEESSIPYDDTTISLEMGRDVAKYLSPLDLWNDDDDPETTMYVKSVDGTCYEEIIRSKNRGMDYNRIKERVKEIQELTRKESSFFAMKSPANRSTDADRTWRIAETPLSSRSEFFLQKKSRSVSFSALEKSVTEIEELKTSPEDKENIENKKIQKSKSKSKIRRSVSKIFTLGNKNK